MSPPIGVVLILENNIILYVYFRMWNYPRPGRPLFFGKRGPRGGGAGVVAHPEVNFTSGCGTHPAEVPQTLLFIRKSAHPGRCGFHILK